MKISSICQAIDEQAAERKRRLGMPRDVLPQLPSVRNFATVVTGVRRSGKSTLLDQWTSENGGNVVSVHFDDLRLASFSAGDFLLLYEIAKERNEMSEGDRQHLTVTIRADRDTEMGIINDVKQELRKAGALNINYSAEKRIKKESVKQKI